MANAISDVEALHTHTSHNSVCQRGVSLCNLTMKFDQENLVGLTRREIVD